MQTQTKIKAITTLLLIMQLTFQSIAQEIADTSQTEEPNYKIHVLAKVTDTEIVLRWAPDNQLARVCNACNGSNHKMNEQK